MCNPGLHGLFIPAITTGMQALQDIFALWPSIREMADALNEKSDTVLRWRIRGRIPEDAWPKLIEEATSRHIQITANDLLTLNRPMKRRGNPPGWRPKRKKVVSRKAVR